jgi:Spy/CpxP family protein refolding chaperone
MARYAPSQQGGLIMKRKVTGLVIVVMALLIVFAAGCRKPWTGDGQFVDHFVGRLDDRVETLNLTDAQKTQYEDFKLKLQTNLEEFGQDRQVFRDAMKTELSKENPDMVMAAENLKQRIGDMAQFASDNVDLFMEFYQILDETQQAQVVDIIQEKMERHEKRMSKFKQRRASE